jgi:hypothetical protein
MAITDTQKTDYLYKKIGFSVSKTDVSTSKSPSNESIPSPLVLRGDTIWQQSSSIPNVIPSANSSVITVYSDALSDTVKATVDGTSTANRTWITGLTNWIDPSFGSTYQVKVYVVESATSNPQTAGYQLPSDGSGNNDAWFFDYSSGVLNFADTNLPYYANGLAVSFTGKSIFVSGARYTGQLGLSNFVANTGIGNNLTVSGNISTNSNLSVSGNLYTSNVRASSANANIFITPGSNGYVSVNTNTAFQVPVGNLSTYPPVNRVGMLRWNTELGYLEIFTGATWEAVGIEGSTTNVVSDVISSGDGSTTQFYLSQNNTTTGTLVSINGVIQLPTTSYTVSGNVITFNEPPLSTDIIEVRQYVPSNTISTLLNGNAEITTGYINGVATGKFINDGLTTLTVDSSKIQFNIPLVVNSANTTVSTTTAIIDSFSPTLYRTAKYLISCENYNSNYFQGAEALVVQDGTYANLAVYGVVATTTQLFTLSANIYNSNVSLWATTTTNGNTIKVSATYIPV